MARRIVIIGGPRVGKSTLSERLQREYSIPTLHRSRDIEHLGWHESSDAASEWFNDPGPWICEGVQLARGLRKWLKKNPDTPLDCDIFQLRQPFVPLLPGQLSMTKGVGTVFKEIEAELIKRGARIHKLKNPDDAIGIIASNHGERSVPLKKSLTKAEWEALPEPSRKFYETEKVYVADGENWKLDAETEDVSGLKSALQKERDAAAKLEREKRELAEKYKDVDPVKYAELIAAAEQKESDELKSKGKYDEWIEKQTKKHNDALAAKDAIIATKDAELDRVIIENGLRRMFEDGGVLPERMEDAMDHMRANRRAKRNEKGQLVILDEDGETPLDASPEVFAKQLFKEKKPWLYAPTGNGGSGADAGAHTNGNGGKPTKTRAEAASLSPNDKAAFMEQVSLGKAVLTD